LESDFDEAGIAAVKAAQEMDSVRHVTAGMPTNAFEKCGEMQMARGSFARHPGELGRGYAERHSID
jgi:hypothetical protein